MELYWMCTIVQHKAINNSKQMIGTILNILSQDEYYGISEQIEIAKGKNKIPKSYTEVINQAKRTLKWQSRKPST